MEFGIFTMKKLILIVLFLFSSVYLGYKFYLINQILSVVNNGSYGEFVPSKKVDLLPSKDIGEYAISTDLIKFKTSIKYNKFEVEDSNLMPSLSHFFSEEGGDYKNVFISDSLGKASFLDSLNQQVNVNEFLGVKIESDYDLHSYCFALDHQDLNVFTPIHEIKIFSFCFISRSTYMYNKGDVVDYNLPNKLRAIQVGHTGNEKVALYIHDENKELFLLMIDNFTTDEINLLLSTIEYYG